MAAPGEPWRTFLSEVWSLNCTMHSFVIRETALFSEFFLALAACEWLHAAVNPFVPPEIAARRELRRTFRTAVWLLTGVDAFVS